MEAEDDLGREIPDDLAPRITTVGRLYEYVKTGVAPPEEYKA